MSFELAELIPDLTAEPSPHLRRSFYRAFAKRVLDLLVVVLAAPFVLPIVLLIALFVMQDGHTPFYWSERVGRGGRIFRMLKLRTMVPNADLRLSAYLVGNAAAAAEWDETQKLKHDPRITDFGRMLRKTSLDELPQLWNMLKGDMSLVGPRPMMPDQRMMYPGSAYYDLRPGVTGPWQVSERNDCGFAKRADFDLNYQHTLSFANDVRLLGRTVVVVLRGAGYRGDASKKE